MSARRERSTGIAEQTVLVCALIGSTQMTWGTIVPALPLYLDRFGATALILGPIIAAFGLGRAIVNIPAGVALRWWRPRPFLRTVCVLLMLVTAATGISPDAGVLIVARVAAGVLGGAAITIGFAVLVTAAPPDRRGRVMATATAVQMTAGALGAFLGGVVLSWFPLEAAFLAASAPLALTLTWDALRPAAHYWAASAERGRTAAESPGSGGPAAQHTGIRAVVPALALASFAAFFARFGGEQGLIPLLGYARGGLTPFTLGLALAATTIVSLLAMPLVGSIIDRGARLAVFVPSIAASAAAMALFPLAQGPWPFASAIVVYGLASCVGSVVPSVVMSECVPARRSGFVVGLTRTAGDAGAVIGPLSAFAAYDLGGAWAAAGAVALVLLAANASLVASLVLSATRERSVAPSAR